MYFQLKGKEVVELDRCPRHPYEHICNDVVGDYYVSTVFLGFPEFIDIPDKPMYCRMMFFETAVFNDELRNNGSYIDLEKEFYFTYDEAVAGHQRMLEKYAAKSKKR